MKLNFSVIYQQQKKNYRKKNNTKNFGSSIWCFFPLLFCFAFFSFLYYLFRYVQIFNRNTPILFPFLFLPFRLPKKNISKNLLTWNCLKKNLHLFDAHIIMRSFFLFFFSVILVSLTNVLFCKQLVFFKRQMRQLINEKNED